MCHNNYEKQQYIKKMNHYCYYLPLRHGTDSTDTLCPAIGIEGSLKKIMFVVVVYKINQAVSVLTIGRNEINDYKCCLKTKRKLELFKDHFIFGFRVYIHSFPSPTQITKCA